MPLVLPILIFLSISSAYAGQPVIQLTGDERIALTNFGNPQSGRFCIRNDSAEKLSRNWRVVFSLPGGGLQLKASGSQADPVPFQLSVRPEKSGRTIPVRSGDILARGSSISSHCSNEADIFYLEAMPQKVSGSVAGGLYTQVIKLRLQIDEQDIHAFDTLLSLEVPEQVDVKVAGPLLLPDFTGNSPSEGKIDACIFRNGFGRYAVRMRGDGSQGAYVLKSGSIELSYQVLWKSGARPAEMLASGELSQAYQGDSYFDCRGQPNASIQVKVQPEHELGANSGNYQGLLRITVESR
ncbi:hypothetical protein M3P05_04555 [Sansalvadorimonas sp. 2012CJ34-2]|uniref:Uncharacterized protein n=1 Tax=Parendozoicomonas callyspongiae TaxID=2942213 RepID=A0ABT0PD06_9GAMM|nr:hypothetical protein [Sansalvadorimonas sp. 2012CJ34-2]MCL6269215.1 hypothetical protein [Sansalvadorimonas sp. 2012CJ34-2]